MVHNDEKIKLDQNSSNNDDSNFKSLYGLTPVVENTIINAISNKNARSLKKLIETKLVIRIE